MHAAGPNKDQAPADQSIDGHINPCIPPTPLDDLERFRGGRVMVFAPHPMDDVLGCGGTVRALFEKGCNILGLYMTDGRFGCPALPLEEVPTIRRLEIVNSATVLGIGNLQFLNRPQRGLVCDKASVKDAREAVETYAPSLILLPHPCSPDPDHRAAFRIAQAAVAGEGCEVLQYETWTASRPDMLVDITLTMKHKEAAIRQHRSQQDREDYLGKVAGLNSYRSLGLGPTVSYCEAFSRPGGE